MTAPGWYADPSPGAPAGRLRWFDGRSWTNNVHPADGPLPAPALGLLEAAEVVVGIPSVPAPGTRVFELSDAAGTRLGRLVETTRSAGGGMGVALARAGAWQSATTREARDGSGWPKLILTTTPQTPGCGRGDIS